MPGHRAGGYRRSPGLVVYWDDARLVCFDCISGRRFAVDPEVIEFLHHLGGPSTSGVETDGGSTVDRGAVRSLARLGLVMRNGAGAAWPWGPWMPEAAFFHFGTRARTYPVDPREQDVALRAKAARTPPPPPTKTVAGRRTPLPVALSLGELSDTLTRRRTWRNFSHRPVGLVSLSTLLRLTWGVQRWGTVRGQGRVVLKTSPSGGARHPIEAYVLAVNVAGLPRGAYHYDAATHELVDLRRRVTPQRVQRFLANQDYYRGSAAVVVMTAVIERSMWKYPQSRAYRTILADAGHLGQTFCLTATALGLAPFETMAFHEIELERCLRVDGVTECAMYVVGVGLPAPQHASRPGRISARPRA
jgi:SagB-type dehydrogenase family enzyme